MYQAKYQTVGERIVAGIVDGLIFVPVGILDAVILIEGNPVWLLITWLAFSYPLVWVYSVGLHYYSGQTIGKRVTKIRVVDDQTEGPITLLQAFLRDSVLIVLNTLSLALVIYTVVDAGALAWHVIQSTQFVLGYAALGWLLIEIVTCLFNPKHRALHDFLAGTVVVRLPSEVPQTTEVAMP